jgi:hypothetical protein
MDDIVYHKIWNDRSASKCMMLFAFKEIIRQQLPLMPLHYVLRLLMDKQHMCILAIQLSSEGFLSFEAFLSVLGLQQLQ